MSTCAIEPCPKPSARRGWCHMHYARWRLHGDPLWCPPTPTMEELFWAKVDKGADCWEWTAAKTGTGYGNFRSRGAHRVAYELLVGPIPDGLDLDHLCRNRGCVNPGHLEPVTRKENSLRGHSPAILAHHAKRCREGHSITGDNIAWDSGKPRCRTCRRASNKRASENRKKRQVAA